MSLTKFASFQVLSAVLVPEDASAQALQRIAHRHHFDYEPEPGYLYVRSRAISSRCNDNHDEFPAEEIKQAYRTFIGKPVFVNHANENHRRARGVVIDAALHEDRNPDGSPDTWAEVLMQVDAVKFPKLAKAIMAGHIDRTSMGTDVAFSICSVCNNKATSPTEYCRHIPAMKGQRIYRTTASGTKEGILVREICHGLKFFENSLLVEEPADPTAVFTGVDDHTSKTASLEQAGRSQGTRDTQIASAPSRTAGSDQQAHVGQKNIVGSRDEVRPAHSERDTHQLPVRPHLAYGETIAPADVDTLRDDECPVCGEKDAYDGQECQVCGFVAPPAMFLDPDLDKAKQVDLRKDVTQGEDNPVDQNADGIPDNIPGSTTPGSEEVPGEGIDPEQLDENGDPIAADQPVGPDGKPLAPEDLGESPDLVCPECGMGFSSEPPQSIDTNPDVDPTQDQDVSVAGPEMDAAGDTQTELNPEVNEDPQVDQEQPVQTPTAAEGDACPNCGQATLMSVQDVEQATQPSQDPTEGQGDPWDNQKRRPPVQSVLRPVKVRQLV